MELLFGMMELAFLGNIASIVLGLPVLVVLGGVTLALRARSRRSAQRTGTGDTDTPPVTPFARPARVLSVALVAIGCVLATAVLTSVLIASPEGAWGTAFGAMMAATMVGMDVVAFALFVVLVFVARDVSRGRFAAGRDTWSAYGIVLVAQAVALILAAAGGALGLLKG